jgi:transcriptional regulator with XRE-family HTH domain
MTSRRQTNILRTPKQVAADLKAIGRRIREIRGFDLTQSDFGKMLGITQAQLSKYELGQSAPTPDILLKLKTYSGKSIDWILTGEEPGART